MSTLNYSLSQLNDPKTCTHIQFPIKHDTGGKIGLIQDIDFGVMKGFGYVTDRYDESSQINNFVSFVTTLDLLFKNLNTRINDLKSTVDKLMSESLIASIETKPTANSLTYNGNSQNLITPGMANNGEIHYSFTYDGKYSTSVPQKTNAGTYTVFYYAKGNDGYNDSAKYRLDVTIAKASSFKTAPTVKSAEIPHDNSYHDLINAGTTNSGTMEYGVNENNSSTTTPPSDWSSNIPQRKDSGKYYIWYRITNGVDSTNYEPTNATYLGSVTIATSTIAVTNISLTPTSLTLNANESGTITADVSPSNATNKTINLSSSDTTIATVTASTTSGQPATVAWKKAGTCTITATAAGNTSKIATCTVTCKASTTAVTSISLNPSSLTLSANESKTITATVLPQEASNKTINWTSSDTTIATVTASTTSGQPATVAWKKAGTCTITATAAGNTSKIAICTVTCQKATNNCYIGVAQELTFTKSDLNQYVAAKPETIELPVGTRYDVSVWIYPESWGKPIKANPIIDGSVMTEKNDIDSFIYSGFTLPEGYIGCYIALDSATTYKLTWQ